MCRSAIVVCLLGSLWGCNALFDDVLLLDASVVDTGTYADSSSDTDEKTSQEWPHVDVPDVCQHNTAVATGTDPLFDDFSNDLVVHPAEDRDGMWMTFDDGTGDDLRWGVIDSGGGPYDKSLRLAGSGYTDWGISLAAWITWSPVCYDASVYRGISFWFRGYSPAPVSFRVSTAGVLPPSDHGGCNADCYDSHCVEIEPGEWQEIRVLWEELHQLGFGREIPFDPRTILRLEWHVEADELGSSFVFQLAGIRFITED